VAVGDSTLHLTTASNGNTAVGSEAGSAYDNGNNCTFIGRGADANAAGYSNATAIGFNATAWGSQTMRFGGVAVDDWGFGVQTQAGEALRVGNSGSNGNGAYLTEGGTWTNASDRALKTDISTLSSQDVLNKVRQLEITRWSYTGTDEYHIGPMAQDFHSLFNVGIDDTHISTIDPAGVALISIQELAQQNDRLASENVELRQELDVVKQELEAIRTLLAGPR
jgi:hypothetical protein